MEKMLHGEFVKEHRDYNKNIIQYGVDILKTFEENEKA